MKKLLYFFGIVMISLLMWSCGQQKNESNNTVAQQNHPNVDSMLANAVIYEVNLRQFTPEGTIKAFMPYLDSLKDLGVDILWFMPVQPIGELNRKGPLGSYYSIKNYKEVNPEFGSAEDFKKLIEACHQKGFYVILDWVANHSAFDNPWALQHPDWYVKDSAGNIRPPIDDWNDVADLNYESAEMRRAMINAMKHWVNEYNIDGFRCDVAFMVPADFWQQARQALDSIRPLFMLAEAEEHQMEIYDGCFNAYYGWELHHVMNEIAKGNKKASALDSLYQKKQEVFEDSIYSMNFITNHDENSWNGTIFERMPNSWRAMALLSYTWPGIPLLYTGQEKGLEKRLRFFDKDTLNQSAVAYKIYEFYQALNDLKGLGPFKTSPANNKLYNLVATDTLISFERRFEQEHINIIINLSSEMATMNQTIDNKTAIISENWNDKTLGPWGYVVYKSN